MAEKEHGWKLCKKYGWKKMGGKETWVKKNIGEKKMGNKRNIFKKQLCERYVWKKMDEKETWVKTV